MNWYISACVTRFNMEANMTAGATLTDFVKTSEAEIMDKIYPALLETFGIISLGYLAGK